MTIFKLQSLADSPLRSIRNVNLKEHQKWHPNFDYYIYEVENSLSEARALLMAVVDANGTNFQFKKLEFCGREELIATNPEYTNKHTFVVCLQYPKGYKTDAPGCRHDVLLIEDALEIDETNFLKEILEIESYFDSISTYQAKS